MEFVCLSGGVLHWPLPLHDDQCPWARMTWKSPLRSALHPSCCRAGQVNGSLASSLPCDRALALFQSQRCSHVLSLSLCFSPSDMEP